MTRNFSFCLTQHIIFEEDLFFCVLQCSTNKITVLDVCCPTSWKRSPHSMEKKRTLYRSFQTNLGDGWHFASFLSQVLLLVGSQIEDKLCLISSSANFVMVGPVFFVRLRLCLLDEHLKFGTNMQAFHALNCSGSIASVSIRWAFFALAWMDCGTANGFRVSSMQLLWCVSNWLVKKNDGWWVLVRFDKFAV